MASLDVQHSRIGEVLPAQDLVSMESEICFSPHPLGCPESYHAGVRGTSETQPSKVFMAANKPFPNIVETKTTTVSSFLTFLEFVLAVLQVSPGIRSLDQLHSAGRSKWPRSQTLGLHAICWASTLLHLASHPPGPLSPGEQPRLPSSMVGTEWEGGRERKGREEGRGTTRPFKG